MSKRLTVVSLALMAIVAFLVGAIVAGGGARSSVAAGPSLPRAASIRSAVRAGAGPGVGLVNFADVVERINPAVVNIDATARGRDPRRRGRLRVDPSDPFEGPDSGGRGDAPRRGAGSGFII